MTPFLRETNRQTPGIRLIALAFFQLETVNDFVLIGTKTFGDIGSVFPGFNVPSSPNMRRLLECLIHHQDIPYYIASDQRTYYKVKEAQCWVYTIH